MVVCSLAGTLNAAEPTYFSHLYSYNCPQYLNSHFTCVIYYLWRGCDGDFVTEPVYHGNPCGHTLKASDFVEKLSE